MAFAGPGVSHGLRPLRHAPRCPRRRARLPTRCRLRASFLSDASEERVNSSRLRRFALISDVHVFDEKGIWAEDVTQFLGQRLLGLLNIVLLRGPRAFDRSILEAALSDMRTQDVEHLVVAGDISNLSIASEFALAAKIFRRFGGPSNLTVCPGNHDTYNRGQKDAALFREHFGTYCQSDLPRPFVRKDGFPYAHFRGGVLFIVLNTGLPNTARGIVGKDQWAAAEAMLDAPAGDEMRRRARATVLVLHHPAQDPSVRGVPWIREFKHDNKDWPEVARFANKYGVGLVVHGHMHVPYRGVLAGTESTLVYESGSGTLVSEDPARMARYTVFDLDEDGKFERTYARVFDTEKRGFDTLELPVPVGEGVVQRV